MAAGIKASGRPDLAVVVTTAGPAAVAAVFTPNTFAAAPVRLSRANLAATSGDPRGGFGWANSVISTSGSANAATGPAGDADQLEIGGMLAAATVTEPDWTLHLSTGIIGSRLPLEKVRDGLAALIPTLAATDDGLLAVATALCTTDSRTKVATTTVELPDAFGRPVTVRVSGVAKGVGMIHPQMATMLSLILTDANIAPDVLWPLLRPAAARTWNQLSVDGDTSTNDTVFVLASGVAGAAPAEGGSAAEATLGRAIEAIARDLARQQAADGEGASTLITAAVSGARDDAEARAVARSVISSSLVKAAAHGRDPNWGRIAGAAGNARLADRVGARGRRSAGGRGGGPCRFAGRARSREAPHLDRRSPRLRRIARRPGRIRSCRGACRDARRRSRLRAGPRSGLGEWRGLRLRSHRGIRDRELGIHDMSEVLVIKLGGTTIADQSQVLAEVAAVARRRPVVLVHGGGKRITEWLERLGVPSKFEGGLRVTDAQSLEVAAAVLRGVVNSELVSGLRDLGVDAVGLSGVDGGLLIAERIPKLGLVASVVGLRRDLLDAILVGGQVPVVAPLARDADGIVCNVNADDVAAGIAAGLGARQLVLLTDVDGVRDADGRRLDALTAGEAETLIESGVIAGGMVPKVRAALGALGWEGAEAIIADSAAPEALDRALNDPTFGTRITATRAATAGAA